MRTKDDILKELHQNRQPGMYGGIPPDTLASIQTETFIDIRDILDKLMLELYRGLRAISKQN